MKRTLEKVGNLCYHKGRHTHKNILFFKVKVHKFYRKVRYFPTKVQESTGTFPKRYIKGTGKYMYFPGKYRYLSKKYLKGTCTFQESTGTFPKET